MVAEQGSRNSINQKRHAQFYSSLKTIYGPRSCSITPLKAADGLTILKDKNQILARWVEYFHALLNHQSPIDYSILEELPNRQTIQDLDHHPTFLEVLAAIKSLKKNYKSPGNDGIPAELLKQDGYLCTRMIHQYILQVWELECVPQQWRDANIVTLYKNKGEKSICSNSRGISLLAIAGNVLAKIMNENLTEHLLPESQCGFRKNRSTVDMIFTVRQLQEKCREQHQDLFMAFVGLSKAFDTVNRELLWDILTKFGCPKKIR